MDPCLRRDDKGGFEMTSRQKVISIGLTVVLLIGLVVGVVLVQRQQILKSRASLQAYNAFAVASGDSEHYVRCTGNVCETNTLSITMSVRDLQALNIQDQVAAAKTPQQCQQELGEPPPFCDASSCVKNTAIADNNQCYFKLETVDLSLCPNNCQSDGTQTILCREAETCQKYSSGQLTGKLIKYWINEIGGIEGCQAPQESEDTDKCPTGQTLAAGQYTAAGGGLTGQVNAGTAPIPFCSVQDYATPCWMGADCKEENQTYANKACSNNHGAGSRCTRSTGASDVFEDGCTQPESNVVVDSCSGQYITACWQGADCKEDNQASANAVCSQNHGPESVCTRATGMGNVFEDGCTYGTSGQIAAGIKKQCTSEAYATSCWQDARCDETNQRFADRTCINNHGEGSVCTRSTGVANTNNDGCTKTVVDVAQTRRVIAAQKQCSLVESCDEEISERVISDSCGKIPETRVFDASCRPDLSSEQAIDLNLESKKQAALAKKQEAEKQDKPFWEKAGDMLGGAWNGIASLGKGAEQAPKFSEVKSANSEFIERQVRALFSEGQRNAEVDQEQLQKLLECQRNYRQAIKEGREPEDCSSVIPQVILKNIDEQTKEAQKIINEGGRVWDALKSMGVNPDVQEAKIEKVGLCLIPFAEQCYGFTGEVTVPADASQNLSEVLRKAEVVKLAESLGLDLEKDDPKNWEVAKREFFFNAAARTDINAGKFMAEFLGVPISAWENADEAAKICARDHRYACFVNSNMPPSSWIQSVSNEQIDQLNQVSQNYFPGFEPAPPELLRKYGYLVDVNVLKQTGKQFSKPLAISDEDWNKVLRTFRVYAQVGDNVKNYTEAGRLYNEKQSEAILETYIGFVSTVVDPVPVAQALSSSLKYVIVKQVWNRLSDRVGPKVASEIAQNAEKAIARGTVATAAERKAVDAVAEAAWLPPTPNAADQIRIIVDSGVVEPPPAVSALRNAADDPEVQRIAAQGIPIYHNGSGRLDGPAVVISPENLHFVAPDAPTNPVRAVQDGINGLVDDVESLLNRGPPAPAVEVAERAAGSFDNPVLDGVTREGEEVGGKLAQVADHLDETASRVGVEPSVREPNPAEGILVDGRDRAAGVINGVGETADAVGKEVDRFVHGSAIEDARSIDELYQAIQARGNIQGSQKSYTPDELIYLIEGVRSGDRQLNYITSKGGLRDKVRELVEEEARAVQKTIQAEIETRNYVAAVNVVDPPKPVRSNRIDPEKAKQWVASHDTLETRQAAQAIVDNTRYISQEEFEAGLRRSVKSLNESLPAGEDYTVLIQNGKSNKWVTELALPQMDSLPSQVIDIDNISAVGLTKSKRFVFFDDAIYSGSQMRQNVQSLLMTLNQRGVDMSGITIHVISPYATNYGKTEILGLLSGTAFRDAKIVFGSHEFLPSVEEAIGDLQIISSIQKMYKHGAQSRTLTYFDHKIPDFISTLAEALNNGEIRDLNGVQKGRLRFIPETHAPYHGANSQQAALSELEQKMKGSGQGKYLVSSIPEVGPQIEKQVYFVKTGEGDLVALKYGSEVIPAGQIRRGDEIITLNDKPSVKLKKGDEVILGSATLSPTTSGSAEHHLFYDGEKLVKDIPLPETAGKYPAPCPIFTLIPVALAQELGGGSPCPKGPLAALARNAGNAFKQAKDGVGGIFDRFRPPKAESGLDRIVPTSVSEIAILNKAKILEAVTDKDISLLNKAGAEVARQAQNFDYVIVSGQSSDISETILRKQGVDPNKIIRFSTNDNANVYKIVEDQATQLTEAERNSLTREALEKRGINLSADKKPTFLIVDDISDTGYKATAYLDRFSQIEGVGETQYAALSVLRGTVIDPRVAGTGNFANFSRERLEQLAQKTFAPSKLTPAEKLRAAYVLDNLSRVLEGNTLTNDTISYNVLVNSRITARKVLERISGQKPNPIRAVLDSALSTAQNTGRQVGDTVGGWVDNFKGIFKREGKEGVSTVLRPQFGFQQSGDAIVLTPDWGKTVVNENLRNARRNPDTHGPAIIAQLSQYLPPNIRKELDQLPSDVIERANFIAKHIKDIRDEDLIAIADNRFKTLELNRIDYEAKEFLGLKLSGQSAEMQKALQKVDGLEKVSLVLQSDGTELTIFRKQGTDFVARVKTTSLDAQTATNNFFKMPDFIPQTEMVVLETGDSGSKVLLLSRKIEDGVQGIADEEVAGLARKLGDYGFVPDLHLGNLIKDSNGKLWYIDQDAVEHFLSNSSLGSSREVKEAVEEEIQKYLASVKELKFTTQPASLVEPPAPNPAAEILTNVRNGIKEATDNVAQVLGIEPRELKVVSGDPNLGTMRFAESEPPPFKFTNSSETTVKVGDRTYSIGDKYVEADGRVIVPIRLDDGTVTMAYLSISEKNFKWYVGIDLDHFDGLILKSNRGKEVMDVPLELEKAIKEALGNKKVELLGQYSSLYSWQIVEFHDFLQPLGFARHGRSENVSGIMDQFLDRLGVTEREITAEDARKIAASIDFEKPVDIVHNRASNTIDVYYRGELEGVPQQIRYSYDLNVSGNLNVSRGKFNPEHAVDFTIRPADDPLAVYKPGYEAGSGKGVPSLARYGADAEVDPGWDEISKLGRESNFGKTVEQLTNGYKKQPSEAEISRFIEEMKPEVGLAPCPIFSLISIAYAQGFTPCPKSPVAAMARNAGNAFKQAKDGIGGWVDNFKGIFKREIKEVPVVQRQLMLLEPPVQFTTLKPVHSPAELETAIVDLNKGNVDQAIAKLTVIDDEYATLWQNGQKSLAILKDELKVGDGHPAVIQIMDDQAALARARQRAAQALDRAYGEQSGKALKAQRVVQQEIESANYVARVNVVDPPKPVRSNRIDPEKAKQWVASHDTLETRQAAQAIVDNTRYISQEEFEAGLRRSVKSLNESLPAGEDYMVLIDYGKSNQWVAELALPQMERLPAQIGVTEYLLGIDLTAIRRFVFFDDGIYSGSQMWRNVGLVMDQLQKQGVDLSQVTVHIVAPYATEFAQKDIIKDVAKYFKGVNIEFARHEIMPSVEDVIKDQAIRDQLRKMYNCCLDAGRTLTYFDHKIPDDVSTLANALNGFIRSPDGTYDRRIPYIPETPVPYRWVSSSFENEFSQIEQKMVNTGQDGYLAKNAPFGKQLDSSTRFLKTEQGDFAAVRFKVNNEPVTIVQVIRDGETFTLSQSKPYIKLQKGDVVSVWPINSSNTYETFLYHSGLVYNGEKLVLARQLNIAENFALKMYDGGKFIGDKASGIFNGVSGTLNNILKRENGVPGW